MINKKQFTDFLKMIDLPYCILDKNGNYVEVSESYCEVYGYSPSELLGNHFTMLLAERENLEFPRKKQIAFEYFINTFRKYSSFYKHPVLYNVKNKNNEIFNINSVTLDFFDKSDGEYRIAIDFVSKLFLDKRKVHSVKSKLNLTRFSSMEYLTKEIDKYVLLTKNPKFSLFNIRVINQNVHSETKRMFYNIIFDSMKVIFGENSIIAMKGTHHFLILLKEIDKIEVINDISKKIIEFFSAPIRVENFFVKESVKIGISRYSGNKMEFKELYDKSELALKYSNVDNYMIYDSSLEEKLNKEFIINSIIFNGFKNDEFTVNYQPYYCIKTGKIAGMEALMRLYSKEHGTILPNKFIPVLEQTHFIIMVEKRIIELIFNSIKNWKEQGIKIVPVSINLSPLQFNNYELLGFLEENIKKYSIDPKKICFEITESMFMENIDITQYMLEKLREIGFKISIDDFGTGYSSLQYLNEFPIDNLKIDISFIRDINLNLNNKAIVSAIISMSKHLKLKTICEGVENEEELETLKKLDADIIQGFYKSKPLTEENIIKLLSKET